MDLRPKLAHEFAEAIYSDFERSDFCVDILGPDARDVLVRRWQEIILERFVSHALKANSVELFLEKYPGVRRLLDVCKAEALRRWQNPSFRIELGSNPDRCGICYESQYISLTIVLDIHPDSYLLELDEWDDWRFEANSEYSCAVAEIGDVADLFLTLIVYG